MQFKKGTSRYVLILPFLGIVIKFPIIHIDYIFNMFLSCLRAERVFGRLRLFIRSFYAYDIRAYGSAKRFLFLGIFSNWREFCFFLDEQNDFCVPTYFSLFGFLNIQKYANGKCEFDDSALWGQLYHWTDRDIWHNPHHFSNTDNFCVENGKLMILDYGCVETHYVLRKYGERIHQNFNPKIINWDYSKKFEEQLVSD